MSARRSDVSKSQSMQRMLEQMVGIKSHRLNTVGDKLRQTTIGQPAGNLRYASNLQQNVTVFDKVSLDKKTPYREFEDCTKYKDIFNTNRTQAVKVGDAMVNPHATITTHFDRDPGQADLNKRQSLKQDMHSRAFYDDQGRVIVKVDQNHGLPNAGVVYQQTHGRNKSASLQPFRTIGGNVQTPRHQMERRIALVKQMIQNEQQCSKLMTSQLMAMTNDMHMKHPVVRQSEDMLKMNRSGFVPQHL